VTRQASTRDIPAQLEIDAESLRHHLSAVLPELESGVEVSKFTGGQSNPTYLIESAGKRFVLRRKPPGTVLSSAHAIDREARVMRAVASAGFLVHMLPTILPNWHYLHVHDDVILSSEVSRRDRRTASHDVGRQPAKDLLPQRRILR
jgi:Phosphotransferase enzyme family